MHAPIHQQITEAHPIAAMLVRVLAGHRCFGAIGVHDEDIWMNSPIDGTAFWIVSPGARTAKNTPRLHDWAVQQITLSRIARAQ